MSSTAIISTIPRREKRTSNSIFTPNPLYKPTKSKFKIISIDDRELRAPTVIKHCSLKFRAITALDIDNYNRKMGELTMAKKVKSKKVKKLARISE